MPDQHQDIREAVRDLCAHFPAEHHRRIDETRGHPERKFREARLYRVAPTPTNLIQSYVAEHVLGLPRSF